jgi:hypothetical protein
VSFGLFAILFVGSASALAGWMYARLGYAPRDFRQALVHAGASLLACQVVSPAVGSLLSGSVGTAARLAYLLGVVLPALTYGILSIIWVIALIQRSIARGSLR